MMLQNNNRRRKKKRRKTTKSPPPTLASRNALSSRRNWTIKTTRMTSREREREECRENFEAILLHMFRVHLGFQLLFLSVSFHHIFVTFEKREEARPRVLRRRRETRRERVREKGETLFLGESVFVRAFHNPQKGKEE